MQFSFSFKHMESSEALQSYATEKIQEKLEKFVTKTVSSRVAFEVERNLQHVHLTVQGGDGFNMEVNASCPDMYGSIDLLVDKLTVQLKRRKEKLKDHKNKPVSSLRSLPIKDDWDSDSAPIEAEDLIKLEHARKKRAS